MKKLLIILMLALLLPLVSASDWDNVKNYNQTDNSITYSNSFLWIIPLDKIAKATLDTPQINYVIPGKDRRVAEITFENYKDYINAIGSMRLIDKNTNKEITREITYKYKNSIPYDKPTYIKKCVDSKEINITTNKLDRICELKQNGTIREYKDEWLDYKYIDFARGNITLGIYADVLSNDNVEWIGTYFGKEATEWATWTSGFNVGLQNYFDFNSSTPLIGTDALSANEGAPVYNTTNCLIGKCGHSTAGNNFKIVTSEMTFTQDEFTINFWARGDSVYITDYGGIFSTVSADCLSVWDNSNPRTSWFLAGWRNTDVKASPVGYDTWFMGTIVKNGTLNIYLNGSMFTSGTGGNCINSGYDIILGNIFNNAQDWNGNFDEMGYWTRALSSTEINDLWNSGTGLTYNAAPPFASPVVTLNSPVDYYNITMNPLSLDCTAVSQTNITNVTLYINGIKNITRTTGLLSSNIVESLNFPNGNYNWSCEAWDNQTTPLQGFSVNRTFTMNISSLNIVLYDVNYTKRVFVNSNQRFNLSAQFPEYPSLPYLVYNGNSYLGQIISLGGDNYTLTRAINVPLVSTNYTFYWNITYSSGNGTRTNNYTQEVLNLAIDDCSTNTFLLFNSTLRDEDTQLVLDAINLNSTVNVNFNIYDQTNNILGTYNKSFLNDSNPRQCLALDISNNSYKVGGLIEYEADTYIHKFYYLNNYLVNSSNPFNIDLFDLLITRSQEFLLTYKDSNFLPANNVYVYVTRHYVPEGKYKTVEVAKTDNNGQALVHLVLGDVLYTFNFVDSNGNLLSTLTNYVPFCENLASGQCFINTNAFQTGIPISDFTQISGISLSESFNSTNRSIKTDFISSVGVVIINQTVIKYDRFGNNTICSGILNSPSGSITCNIPITYGNVALLSRVYKDNTLISETTYGINDNPMATYGLVGVFFAVLLIITISMLFITSIVGIVFGAIIGLIISGLLNLLIMGSIFGKGSILIWIIVAGSIIAWKVNSQGVENR